MRIMFAWNKRSEHERDLLVAAALGLAMGLGAGVCQFLLCVLSGLPAITDVWTSIELVMLSVGGATCVIVYLSRRQWRLSLRRCRENTTSTNQTAEDAEKNVLPTRRQRRLYAIWLLVFLALPVLFLWLVDGYLNLCREMDLPLLPPTRWLLDATLYAFVPGMFALTWFYFAWIVKRRRRLTRFSRICIVVVLIAVFFVSISLFLPFTMMETPIGRFSFPWPLQWLPPIHSFCPYIPGGRGLPLL